MALLPVSDVSAIATCIIGGEDAATAFFWGVDETPLAGLAIAPVDNDAVFCALVRLVPVVDLPVDLIPPTFLLNPRPTVK